MKIGSQLALVIVLLPLTSVSHADDMADLVSASDEIVEQLNARNVDAVARFFPDQWLVFDAASPLLVVQKREDFKQNLRAFFKNVDVYTWQLVGREVQIYGSTGVTAGHVVLTVRMKDDPVLRTSTFRQTGTWSKVDGKWLLVSTHQSWHPTGEPGF